MRELPLEYAMRDFLKFLGSLWCMVSHRPLGEEDMPSGPNPLHYEEDPFGGLLQNSRCENIFGEQHFDSGWWPIIANSQPNSQDPVF